MNFLSILFFKEPSEYDLPKLPSKHIACLIKILIWNDYSHLHWMSFLLCLIQGRAPAYFSSLFSLVFHPQLILQQKLNFLELPPTLFHASVLLFLVYCLNPPPLNLRWANLTRLTLAHAFGKVLSFLQYPPWPWQAELGAPLMDVTGGIYYVVVETSCLPIPYLDINHLGGKDFFQPTLYLYCPA